jgi:hypothetical protein
MPDTRPKAGRFLARATRARIEALRYILKSLTFSDESYVGLASDMAARICHQERA